MEWLVGGAIIVGLLVLAPKVLSEQARDTDPEKCEDRSECCGGGCHGQ